MSDIGRWQRAKQLFQETLERPARERAAFLARATDDEALRGERQRSGSSGESREPNRARRHQQP